MNSQRFILAGAFEVIALVVILRMWMMRRHKRVAVRLLWSIVLLVPIFGLLAYIFLRENPERHPDYMEERGSGDDAGGGHGADGH